MFDLTQIGARKALAERIHADIDEWCAEHFDDGPRAHLGASVIGQDCMRAAWYAFRWFNYVRPSGRMARLFNRGHREEERFISYLRGIGFVVHDVDPSSGKQFRCTGVFDHFGGSCDGQNLPPARYDLPPGTLWLCEFKTKGTGSGFTKLRENGVAVVAYQHYCQMSLYGWKMGIKYALYIVTNKNDDDLYIEVVELDWNLARELERRAEHVIMSELPPQKIAMSETFWKCKACDFIGVCHRGEEPSKNCRSCAASKPVENGEWFCRTYEQNIPKDFIAKGCDKWSALA